MTDFEPIADIPNPPEAPAPVEGEEPKVVTEEEKQQYEVLVNDIKMKNAVLEAHNEEVKRMKDKVRIEYRAHQWGHNNECAIIKIDNWWDPLPEEEEEKQDDSKREDGRGGLNTSSLNKSKISHTSQREVEAELGFDQIPSKIILPHSLVNDLDVILIHTEA